MSDERGAPVTTRRYCYRIVSHGASPLRDEIEDLDGPADLVLLAVGEGGAENEMDRKTFQTFWEAGRFLAGLFEEKGGRN